MIEKTQTLYELLFRFTNGALTGCHRIDVLNVRDTDTNEVYKSEAQQPEPVDEATASAIFGAQVGSLTAQVQSLSTMLAQVIAERDTIAAERDALAATQSNPQTPKQGD